MEDQKAALRDGILTQVREGVGATFHKGAPCLAAFVEIHCPHANEDGGQTMSDDPTCARQ